MKYVVTNIRVEASMLRSIKLRALERGIPASELIREALRQYLASTPVSREEWDRSWDEFMSIAGTGRSKGKGVSTGSTDIDEVLYGLRRRRKNK
jgi:Arc/MetJ-type ribon-helix-helix transcriptional regulator